MKTTENKIETVFEEMLQKGFLSKGSSWIEKAAAQKSAGLPLSIAQSRILTYDLLDRCIIGMTNAYSKGKSI
jgi:hypothetical protein